LKTPQQLIWILDKYDMLRCSINIFIVIKLLICNYMVVEWKIKKCNKMIKAKTILLKEFSSIKKLKIIVLYYNVYVSIYFIKLLFCNYLNIL